MTRPLLFRSANSTSTLLAALSIVTEKNNLGTSTTAAATNSLRPNANASWAEYDHGCRNSDESRLFENSSQKITENNVWMTVTSNTTPHAPIFGQTILTTTQGIAPNMMSSENAPNQRRVIFSLNKKPEQSTQKIPRQKQGKTLHC